MLVSCIFTCIDKTESLMFSKMLYFSRIYHIESISPCQTSYAVINFINRRNMVLKYDIHFNRMSILFIHFM